jgi:hypothetical protein
MNVPAPRVTWKLVNAYPSELINTPDPPPRPPRENIATTLVARRDDTSIRFASAANTAGSIAQPLRGNAPNTRNTTTIGQYRQQLPSRRSNRFTIPCPD